MPTTPLICNSKLREINSGLLDLGLGVWPDEQVTVIKNYQNQVHFKLEKNASCDELGLFFLIFSLVCTSKYEIDILFLLNLKQKKV